MAAARGSSQLALAPRKRYRTVVFQRTVDSQDAWPGLAIGDRGRRRATGGLPETTGGLAGQSLVAAAKEKGCIAAKLFNAQPEERAGKGCSKNMVLEVVGVLGDNGDCRMFAVPFGKDSDAHPLQSAAVFARRPEDF